MASLRVRFTLFVGAVVMATMLVGCARGPKYTQTQLMAIETREVDADLDETFSAAANALFDAGYTITMSDRLGGLLTGSKLEDAPDGFWGSMFDDGIYMRQTISIQVRQIEPERCRARIKSALGGRPIVNEAAINEIWTLMQRQVLMSLPPQDPAPGLPEADNS